MYFTILSLSSLATCKEKFKKSDHFLKCDKFWENPPPMQNDYSRNT